MRTIRHKMRRTRRAYRKSVRKTRRAYRKSVRKTRKQKRTHSKNKKTNILDRIEKDVKKDIKKDVGKKYMKIVEKDLKDGQKQHKKSGMNIPHDKMHKVGKSAPRRHFRVRKPIHHKKSDGDPRCIA